MKINRPENDEALILSQLNELSLIIERLEDVSTRPCKGCDCPCSSSVTCNCDCNIACPHAPNQLSSEEGRYPIEKKVLPLVFSLSEIQICQPCWSCEGHLSESGVNNENSNTKIVISKMPQVWFYTNSVLVVRLIDDCLSNFKIKKWLNYDWQISATFSDRDCPDCAFAIKPDLNLVSEPKLEPLQSDLQSIADKLRPALIIQAKQYQNHLKNRFPSLIQPACENR